MRSSQRPSAAREERNETLTALLMILVISAVGILAGLVVMLVT